MVGEPRPCPVCLARPLRPGTAVCSPRCRTERWRQQRAEARRARDAEVAALLDLLAAARRALGE